MINKLLLIAKIGIARNNIEDIVKNVKEITKMIHLNLRNHNRR